MMLRFEGTQGWQRADSSPTGTAVPTPSGRIVRVPQTGGL